MLALDMVQSRLKVVWAEYNLKLMQEGKPPVTTEDIAKATGLATSTISGLSTNRSAMVHFRTIAALCAFFECSPGDLFIYTPEQQPVAH